MSAPRRGARTGKAIADRGDRRPGSRRRRASRGEGSPAPGPTPTRRAGAAARSPFARDRPLELNHQRTTRAIPVPRYHSAQSPGSQVPTSPPDSAMEQDRLPSGRVNRRLASTKPSIDASQPGGHSFCRRAPARISRHRGQSRIGSRLGTPSESSSRASHRPSSPAFPPSTHRPIATDRLSSIGCPHDSSTLIMPLDASGIVTTPSTGHDTPRVECGQYDGGWSFRPPHLSWLGPAQRAPHQCPFLRLTCPESKPMG